MAYPTFHSTIASDNTCNIVHQLQRVVGSKEGKPLQPRLYIVMSFIHIIKTIAGGYDK